jgi:hypothetical protein
MIGTMLALFGVIGIWFIACFLIIHKFLSDCELD